MALSDEARQMLQQAVEKALKAWLALLGVEYPRTTTKSWNPLQMIEAMVGPTRGDD